MHYSYLLSVAMSKIQINVYTQNKKNFFFRFSSK